MNVPKSIRQRKLGNCDRLSSLGLPSERHFIQIFVLALLVWERLAVGYEVDLDSLAVHGMLLVLEASIDGFEIAARLHSLPVSRDFVDNHLRVAAFTTKVNLPDLEKLKEFVCCQHGVNLSDLLTTDVYFGPHGFEFFVVTRHYSDDLEAVVCRFDDAAGELLRRFDNAHVRDDHLTYCLLGVADPTRALRAKHGFVVSVQKLVICHIQAEVNEAAQRDEADTTKFHEHFLQAFKCYRCARLVEGCNTSEALRRNCDYDFVLPIKKGEELGY